MSLYTFVPFYAIQRAALESAVNDILQKNYLLLNGNQFDLFLYGHPGLNNADNREILKFTIKYINSTNRFSKS